MFEFMTIFIPMQAVVSGILYAAARRQKAKESRRRLHNAARLYLEINARQL